MTFRGYLMRVSEYYHMFIHMFIGVLIAVGFYAFFPYAPLNKILLAGLLGSLLPDIDHFLFFFIYGVNTKYTKTVKKIFWEKGFRQAVNFCKENHKNNTQIVSHNVLVALLSVLISFWFLYERDSILMFVFMLSWSFHYFFDIAEDYLFFGKLNPNWLLQFNKPKKISSHQ